MICTCDRLWAGSLPHISRWELLCDRSGDYEREYCSSSGKNASKFVSPRKKCLLWRVIFHVMVDLCCFLIISFDLCLYSIKYCMMDFSSRKRGKDSVNIAYSKLEKTLSYSMQGYMVFGILEVSLESFLIYSDDMIDAPEMYSWSLSIYEIFSSCSRVTPNSVSPFWEVR